MTKFLGSLSECALKCHCCALIYCFMPDHLHVILSGENDQADTWMAMVRFKQLTGYWFAQNRPEFAWQKDFHDHVVRTGEDLGTHIRYIAANPVRRGLVALWTDYRYTGSIGCELKVIMADTATL